MKFSIKEELLHGMLCFLDIDFLYKMVDRQAIKFKHSVKIILWESITYQKLGHIIGSAYCSEVCNVHLNVL